MWSISLARVEPWSLDGVTDRVTGGFIDVRIRPYVIANEAHIISLISWFGFDGPPKPINAIISSDASGSIYVTYIRQGEWEFV